MPLSLPWPRPSRLQRAAQGLIAEHRLSAVLANEAVGEAVANCARNGYAVTAIVVDLNGVRQAVLRGDGAAVHTLDSAYAKAYTAASLAPVRDEDFDQGDLRAHEQAPGMTTRALAGSPEHHVHARRGDHPGGRQADRRHWRRRRARRQFRRRSRPRRARRDQRTDEITTELRDNAHRNCRDRQAGRRHRAAPHEVGHKVTVWNRSAAKTKPPTDAARRRRHAGRAGVERRRPTITILTDAAAIDTVYHGASGLLPGDVRGKLFIEMSTVQPQTAVPLAEKVRATGAVLGRCPVGGSTGPARQGS